MKNNKDHFMELIENVEENINRRGEMVRVSLKKWRDQKNE